MNQNKIQTKWNLNLVLTDTSQKNILKLNDEFIKDTNNFSEKWQKNNRYLSDPKVLKKSLDEYNNLSLKYSGGSGPQLNRLWLEEKLDLTNTNVKKQLNKQIDLITKQEKLLEFFTNKLSKISKETQIIFLKSPELKVYKKFLEDLFKSAKYILSEKEENILSSMSQMAYSNWVSMNSEFFAKQQRKTLNEDGKKQEVTLEQLMSLSKSEKKKVRVEAAKNIEDIINFNIDVSEKELNNVLKYKQTIDELRGFKRPDEATYFGDDIDMKIVDSLISATQKYNKTSKRYYKLKATLMNQDKLDYNERSFEFKQNTKPYVLQEAIELVSQTFSKLDPQFNTILQKFFENGQVDVYPQKGKNGGAFCVSLGKNTPSFVLLNFTNTFSDVSTIAHEFGHAINNVFVNKKQPAIYCGTSLVTAEVASTFFEDFVFEEATKNLPQDAKLYVKMNKLNDEISTIHRQIACIKFEQELHSTYRKEGYLSQIEIGKLFKKHMQNYMGEGVLQNYSAQNWWAYWSHIRRYFYNYTYAGGLLISKVMQTKVRENPKFISEVKTFLETGVSLSPKDTFNKLGIDISTQSFWENGLLQIDTELNQTYKLAQKLKKI